MRRRADLVSIGTTAVKRVEEADVFADVNDHHLVHEAPKHDVEGRFIGIEVIFYAMLIALIVAAIAVL